MELNKIFNKLIEGTNFEISLESEVLTSCKLKVRTPIEALNCLLGGGIPLSGIYHTYGPPKGGKSTWLYQTMGMFQKQYPDGISAIVDQESSADSNRLAQLGVDTSKVLRLPTTSIESGFLALLKMIKNKQSSEEIRNTPLFIIWDTISRGLAQDGSTQSRMNAQDRARIIKNYLPQLSAEIEKQPFILGLLNQVIYRVDNYGHVHSEAGGGIALQHDNHLSLFIEPVNSEYDSTESFIVSKWSKMSIDKSKISPELKNIPFKLDTTLGGKIMEKESFFWMMVDKFKIIDQKGGWYRIDTLINHFKDNEVIKKYLEGYSKSYRYNDILNTFTENDLLYDILRFDFTKYISDIFTLQANIIKEYKDELFNSIITRLIPDEEIKEEEVEVNQIEESIQESVDN